ncbi:MAG: hypothetical protein ABI162_18625 [Luteolibacter sp.]
MNLFKISHALPLLIACGLSNIRAATAGPAGIYVIGDTHAVPGEVAKFDFDYVAGYTLRVPWTDIETWNAATQAPQYNFSRMDSTLEELRARGKKMTLEIFINKAPTYLLDPPGISTWTNPHPTQGGVQPLPWDARTLAAYQLMIQSMADHVVPGTSWRIADHPSLESVDASIVGLQGLRDLSNTLINHPDYTRTKFIRSVVDAVSINRLAFSNKYGFLALFLMDDNEGGISMDQAVYERLQTEFNVPGKPSLGYFQETLSDAGPQTATLGSLLYNASPDTYIMFQALRPWTLRAGDPVPPETASGTPITGIRHAWRDYRSTYVEIYGGDILNTANATPLRAWNRFFLAVKDAREGRGAPMLEFPGTPSQRIHWQADNLLGYRVWKSSNLTNWNAADTTEPLDGDISMPSPIGAAAQYYRMEILEPVE